MQVCPWCYFELAASVCSSLQVNACCRLSVAPQNSHNHIIDLGLRQALVAEPFTARLNISASIGQTGEVLTVTMPGYNPSPEQESIYNLIPRYQAPTPKQALYRSKVRVCHILAFCQQQHHASDSRGCGYSTRARSTQSSMRWE